MTDFFRQKTLTPTRLILRDLVGAPIDNDKISELGDFAWPLDTIGAKDVFVLVPTNAPFQVPVP
jgi:hypothetical protein